MRTLLVVFCLLFNFCIAWGQSAVDSIIPDAVNWRIGRNVYGQPTLPRLLDTTWFAKDVAAAAKSQRFTEYASWYFLESFWRANEGQSMYIYGDYQNPLWKHEWHLYQKGTPNKKDMKSLLELVNTYLVHEMNAGLELGDIYKQNLYSNISGTVFLTLALNQLQWPHEVRTYDGHLFIVFPYKEENLIFDCSQLDKLWKTSDRKSAYLDFLVNEGYIQAGEMSLTELIEHSESVSRNQLVALQKIAEADRLEENDPVEAFYRMEIAHYFWPTPEIKERWIAMSKKLYVSGPTKNDWEKVYGMLMYIKLTGDTSTQIKADFNSVLGLAFIHYYENEVLSLGRPVSIPIRRANTYFSDKVLQKDTMNLLAGFDYNSFVNFELFEPSLRGLFHSLSYENSKERSATDYQFYVDALYINAYLDSTNTLLSTIYDVNLNNYKHISDLPGQLKDHYEHGALSESAYHKMCAIFYLSYLDQNSPKNVDDANQVGISSLVYSRCQRTLPEHLIYVESPFLRNKAREYVKRMEPIYADKFISDSDNLERIAEICGMETHFHELEQMSKSEQAKDLMRRLELMEKN